MRTGALYGKDALGLDLRARRRALVLVAFLALSGCASDRTYVPAKFGTPGPAKRPDSTANRPPESPITAVQAPLSSTGKVSDLNGWASDDHLAAFAAFRAGCKAVRNGTLYSVCKAADAARILDDDRAREFFERHFRVDALPGEGVLTGYFAPIYPARTIPDAEFSAPVRPLPALARRVSLPVRNDVDRISPTAIMDRRAMPLGGQIMAPPTLNDSDVQKDTQLAIDPIDQLLDPVAPPDLTPAAPPESGKIIQSAPLREAERALIDQASAEDAIAWMRPEDLFFMQIQGSGVLVFPDGQRKRAAFAGDNGKPFVGIARVMVQDGLLPRNGVSGDAIRRWLSAHAGPEAELVMRKNPRYVFFSVSGDVRGEPLGAAGVPLPPGRAIAMDATHHVFGAPYWIDAEAPIIAGASPQYHRLAVALDTGGAIRGPIRADLYFGTGDAAGREAGKVRHVLKLARLVPIDPETTEPGDASTARSGRR